MACKLQSMNGQRGVYTAESVQELKNYISEAFYEALENSDGGANAGLLKVLLKKALHKIGDTYSDLRLLNAVVTYVEEVASEEEYLGISEFFPEAGLYNTLSTKFRDKASEEKTQNSYLEGEVTKEELGFIKTLFLDNFLGNKAKLKNLLKQDVTHKLLSTFIIDRQNGKLITDIKEANNMARLYKQLLFDVVMDYFKRTLPSEYNMSSTSLYNGDNYTGILLEAKLLTRYLDALTPAQLQAIHDSNIDKYNAITAWFTLKNFDNFVDLLLGDVIRINPEHRNTFKDGDGYQYSDKGSLVITSWRTDDNIILESEIGALAQSLINSTPFYKHGINNKTNKFIKFEDFYRMITKMKDLSLNPESRKIIFSRRTYPYLFGEDSDLTLQELQLIENKSLRSIINNIRTNPQVYTRLAMRMLIQGDIMKSLEYTEEERDKTYSIYKGFFSSDDLESIYRILHLDIYDHNVKNYYSLITQVADSLFTVNFLQYNEDDGIVTVRTLKDQGSDNIRKRIEANISGFNSKKIIQVDFENLLMNPYLMSPIINETTLKFEGISFTIKREEDFITDTNYDLTISLTDLGQTLTIRNADGKILLNKDLTSLLWDYDFRKFIDDLLNLGLVQDLDLIEAIRTIYSEGSAMAAMDLLTLAANVYMNKYVSNVLLKNVKGRKNTLAKLNSIYSDSNLAPTYNSKLGEINLLPNRLIPSLNRIAVAKSITTGEALSAQVRDAEGNMLSSLTLSRLLGSLQSQWEKILESPNSAAKGFSLLQTNLFKGCYTTKDYKSALGNKDHTKFTVAESIQGNFLYDFIGGFISVDNTSGKKIIGNGIIGLLPSVNSDKSTIGRMIIDLSQECKVEGIPSIVKVGKNKTWAELTVNELQQVIMKELGQSYETAYNNVVSDFKTLQTWLASYKNILVNIDPETHFRELNEYCENKNVSTSAQLYEWTKEYNSLYSNKPIRLIEQTHYIINGRGIKFNNTFNALRTRYSDINKLSEFFDLKRTEILKSLVDENVEINLFNESTDKTTPKGWLRNNFPDWIHKSNTIKNGKMVFAKLTYNGITYNITSKSDLKEFNDIVSKASKNSVDFILNPHKLLNPAYGIKVELHPMLDKYNTMDYLFTLEFMIAGVGSHINHPGKAKYKTPVIWAHPGIGKTYAIENTQYKNQIIDWDVEFNHRRDAWIAKQSGTIKGTDDFKVARNEYLINWKNHEDFLQFVTKEWERIKQLANSQNKILVASPHMLLLLFPNDFNLVLTMSKEDFIERNVARGANDAKNSGLWKDGIDTTINNLANNPVFSKKITIVNKGEYLQNILDNGRLYNALAQLRENEMLEEAARFLAQHKRNVSYTAAMHEFLLGSINGIPSVYNMAVIDDIKSPVYTISGDRGNHAPLDGATFVNPFVVIWENNSLEGDKAGIDKKLFIHYYDEATGTGGIVKTAGFGLTNDRIKRYLFYRDMMHNMTNRIWKNPDGTNHIAREGGILIDFNGKDVNYGPIYFKKGNKYYMREINSYVGNNIYKTTLVEVDETGDPIESPKEENIPANSNYGIWLMFGGHNSMELKNGQLIPSEKSIQLTARAANNYGIKKPEITKVMSADDIIQPMKMADIHYMPTVGAIKQGACNVNPKSCFYGHNYLNFMQVKMLLAGILLDKEHHADNSELSLMTLVISAACANGYKPEVANKLYNALYSLTKVGTREFRNEIGDMLIGNEEKFNLAVTGIIMKAMLNSTSSDGDLVQAIALDLLKEMKTSHDFSFSPEFYKKADSILPNSDPTIYPKIVNMLTVALTKSGIKTKMAGILAVLCPSHEIIKFYKIPAFDELGLPTGKYKRVTIDKLEEFYNTDNLNSILDLLQEEEPVLLHSSDIEMGYKYLITHTDGTLEVIHINRIHGKLQNIGFRTYNGMNIPYSEVSYEDFKKMDKFSILEWVKEGLDLKSYNVRFEDIHGNKYLIADLEIVLDYFKIKDEDDPDTLLLNALMYLPKYGKQKEFIDRVSYDLRSAWGANKDIEPILNILNATPLEILKFCNTYTDIARKNLGKLFKSYLLKRASHFMNREMQLALNGISPDNASDTVFIDGKLIKIKKDSIQTSSYGLIMPKTFKSNLGLDDFDDLEDIKNDPMFFVKKLANKFGTKVEIYENDSGDIINNYHLELKRSNGKHVYIRTGLTGSDLIKEVEIFKRTDENGNIFRINSNNEIMYLLHSDQDKVYQDLEGNEIIITTPDVITWTDTAGNIVDISKMDLKGTSGGTWIDMNTGNEVIRNESSGMLFYLDSLDYASFSISRACTDTEFVNLLNKASNSSNLTAYKLAKNIINFGENTKESKKINALRKLVNKMNDYTAMLKDAQLKDFAMLHLKELGEQMYTSFLRSLEIIAARIPAQSLQSFMSMQVEAYDNPDINSAYVSLFLFYLQGSDLDIDAVSLQTFELGRNGLYIGHSPYYTLNNEDTRKASDLLPFPTGIKIIATSSEKLEDSVLGILTRDNLVEVSKENQSLFNLSFLSDNSIKVRINLTTAENLIKFGEFIAEINEKGFKTTSDALYIQYAQLLSNKFPDAGIFTLDKIKSIVDLLIKIVDNHNLYINKAKPSKREQIIKNYVTLQLREIIEDPVNRRLADSSVDVVTGPAKDLAKLSPKATVQTTFTPGNVVNKFLSISENMVGKDGIAICATGLKSFFALTEMYLEILNKSLLDESDPNNKEENDKILSTKDSLLFNVSFGGKTYRGLANGFAKNFKSRYEHNITEEELAIIDANFSLNIQEYLIDLFWASDAANEMSALLGLSTDNAKELVLAKINAGTASIGMYLYGLSIGIPFELLYEVMTSPLAFRLTELTKGDLFNGDAGTINIVGALRYLKLEPTELLHKFNNIDLSEYNDILKPSGLFREKLKKSLLPLVGNNSDKLDELIAYNGILRTLVARMLTAQEGKYILDSLRDAFKLYKNIITNPKLFELYEILYNLVIDFAKQYVDDAFLIKGGTFRSTIHEGSHLYDDLEVLATGAEELKLLGKILRLNLEIKTNSSDLINQVNNIEEAIIRRAKLLKSLLSRKGINARNFKGDPAIKEIIFNKLLNEPYSKGGYRIDFEQFITNSIYADLVIEIYDLIKLSYNPLRVLKTVPHYKGYSETLLDAYKGLRQKSVKFKVLCDKPRSFCEEYDIKNPTLRDLVVKNAEKGIDLYLRLAWMRKYIKPITIPASTNKQPVYAFIDTGTQARVLNFNTEIQLGTELGDANYKLWIETVVIPLLKSMYPDNIFLKDLQPIINTNTNLGSVSVNYGLPINMLPKTDYERDVFNDYKESFNLLIKLHPFKDGAGKAITILDIFYYYSLIANGGKVGPMSMHGIFEDYINREGIDEKYNAPKNYRTFISEADSSPSTYKILMNFLTQEMLAPFASPYSYGTRILKYRDKDTDKIELYIKPKPRNETEYDDYENDYMLEVFGYEEMMEQFYDSKRNINGFTRSTKETIFHNSDNRNYFLNPIAVNNLTKAITINLTAEELKQYPTLSRFQITLSPIKTKKGYQAGLVDITSLKPEDKNIIELFIDHIRKDNKGFILSATTVSESGIADVIPVKKWLNGALEALENNCI